MANLVDFVVDPGWCWDCEAFLHTWEDVFCMSCLDHREDGHAPEVFDAEFCHGAGPMGMEYERLQLPPRALALHETIAEQHPNRPG